MSRVLGLSGGRSPCWCCPAPPHRCPGRHLLPHIPLPCAAAEATQAQDAEPGSIPQPEGGAQEGAEQAEASTSSALPFGFPTSLVRKIALVDGDVQRIGADAVRALAKATELFVELLALKAAEVARSGKRKNFKFQDIVAAAKRDRRLLDMGLPDVLEKDPVFAEVHGRAEDENQLREANQRKAADKEQQKGLQQITSFFSAAPTAAAAGPAAAAEPASG